MRTYLDEDVRHGPLSRDHRKLELQVSAVLALVELDGLVTVEVEELGEAAKAAEPSELRGWRAYRGSELLP